MTRPPFTAQVRDYLADCAAYPGLDRKYHPTEDGAVKLIWHRGPDEADQIRAAFRAAATHPATGVAPATLPPGPRKRAVQLAIAQGQGDDTNALPAA